MAVQWGEDFYEGMMEMGLNIDENDILEAFIKSQTLRGKFERKVRFGKTDLYYDATGRMSQRTGRIIIDAVCKENKVVRVIEVEKQLTYAAIGQALVYSHLYGKGNPDVTVIPAIVCVYAEEDFINTCVKCGIEVYFCEYGHVPGW